MDTLPLTNAPAPVKPVLSLKIILSIAALAIFTILITWRARVLETTLQDESAEPSLVNKPAPEFSATTLDGQTVSLADFRGKKKVVVSFWASWCGPCRLEMPALIQFYKKNHTASSDFELLAVSIDEDTKEATDFASAQKLNFPVLLDPTQKVANAYNVDGIPTMFVIDKEGKIIYGKIGYDMLMEAMLSRQLGIGENKPEGGANDGGASH
jgi:peroxiredoxin